MAVLPMQRISIFALKKNRKEILEWMQRRGTVEINRTDWEDSIFRKMDTSSSQALFEKSRAAASQALDILSRYDSEKKGMLSMLDGKREITWEEFQEKAKNIDVIMKKAYQLQALQKEMEEQKADVLRWKTQRESLQLWLSLDVSMLFRGTKSTAARIGILPGEITVEGLLDSIARQAPEIDALHVEVICREKQQTTVFLLGLKRDEGKLDAILRSMGFSSPPSPTQMPPAQQANEWEQKIQKLEEDIAHNQKAIQELSAFRDDIQFAEDYYAMRIEKYRTISQLAQSKHTFLVEGYLPARNAAALERELAERFPVAVEVETPEEKEDTPVLLHNNRFAAPVEPVLENYSLPKRGEVDPSFVMAIFYYIFFGMMLSDAAYGLIMVIVCGLVLHKKKNMEPRMRKSIQMFYYCGYTTIFWGVLFGSYFGNAVDMIAATFFHTTVTIPPLWFIPMNEPMRLLVFSFLLGIIHLFTGLGVQLYQLFRAKKYKDVLYDVGFWYLLVGGGIIYLLSMDMIKDMLALNFVLPPIVGIIAAVCAGIGAVGIIATAGRDSKNPFKRFLKGLYGLYNISGYLSDILSYSRLLALGLATGVIASVFNQMGAMVGDGVLGAIVFVLVFVIGHTLNIAINLLGAYVHTNRLQYVEFFGKFFEGGGRAFAPFSANTKYYKIREDH